MRMIHLNNGGIIVKADEYDDFEKLYEAFKKWLLEIISCPACNSMVILKQGRFNLTYWQCIKCKRIWGVETNVPIFGIK